MSAFLSPGPSRTISRISRACSRPSGVSRTLPNAECPSCVLQVIQVMGSEDGTNSGSFAGVYFECADVAITASGAVPPHDGGADRPVTGSGGAGANQDDSNGCAIAPARGRGGAAAGVGVGLGLLALRRRRGRRRR